MLGFHAGDISLAMKSAKIKFQPRYGLGENDGIEKLRSLAIEPAPY
jgi:hypothetical protein